MKGSIFIGIDYDAWRYKAVVISQTGQEDVRFETANPEQDYRAANSYGFEQARLTGLPFMSLSSLEHFISDHPGWRFDQDDMLVPKGGPK